MPCLVAECSGGQNGGMEMLNLFNQSFSLGEIPAERKTGIVIPIPKPGKNKKDITHIRASKVDFLLNEIEKILGANGLMTILKCSE